MVQQVKDLAFTLLWLGPLLWQGFDPWPGNFCMSWLGRPKKKKKKKELNFRHLHCTGPGSDEDRNTVALDWVVCIGEPHSLVSCLSSPGTS